MNKNIRFAVNPGWRIILSDLGINIPEMLRLSALPEDLFLRKEESISTEEFFRLWNAIDFLFDNPSLPILLIQGISTEVFDPPIFASFCSPNFNVALKRLSQFKPLIGPMKLDVDVKSDSTRLSLYFLEEEHDVPSSLMGMELCFFVQLARMATRSHIVPLQVFSPKKLAAEDQFADFFGVPVSEGDAITIVFSAEDAAMPFVTQNEQMWAFFEPDLRKRLAELNVEEGMKVRVRNALLDMLPSGQTSADDLARRLFVSRRTLQRRLGEEGTSFKEILANVREELARHYISSSDLPYGQISFLLGYEDPNSFFRAFQSWTGVTPNSLRNQPVH